MATTRGESVFKPKNRSFELFLALDFSPFPNVKDSRVTRVSALHTYTFFKAYLHSLQILHKTYLMFENQCG